jgi:pyruvate dehydrogenase E2 component (dihydrolipoamide acetyltransferase)
MEKGNIAKWLKKEGDSIKPGDILAQIETDKATVDFEMQEEGYIAKLMYPEGAKDVKLGQVVAIIVESKDDVAKFKDYQGASAAPAAPQRSASTGDRVFASPLAKKVAAEKGLDLAGI